ncbi:MAG TPA: MFS transporter, partial [Acidimicrobiales bacterium]|nr:MFS transporter [Acidimicrobiales bacterium]
TTSEQVCSSLSSAAEKSDHQDWRTPGVVSVGAASFFSDSGHEVATALLPSFVVSVLHSTAGALGVIEGVSDALMGVAKLIGGPLANDPGRRRRLATSGYLGTAVATSAIGLAGGIWQVGLLRATAWMARGVRSPARDSLLSGLASPTAYGKSFGVERAGDNLGAVAGPLLAAWLVGWIGIRPAIWCAAIPGALAAIAITVAAHEARSVPPSERARFGLNLRELHRRGLWRPMLPVVLFECGNMAVTLLILRATQLLHTGGRSLVAATTLALVLYAGHNTAAALGALMSGRWIDHSSPRVAFALGALLYMLAYGTFALGSTLWPVLLGAFVVAGAAIGLSETSESVLVALAAPESLRGSAFGALGGVQALGDIVSSATVGLLYATVSPLAAFSYAGAWMVLSLVSSVWLVTQHSSGAASK